MRASIRGGCFASFEALLQFLSHKSFKRDGQQEEKMEMSDRWDRGQERYVCTSPTRPVGEAYKA